MLRQIFWVSPLLALGGCGAEQPSGMDPAGRSSGKLSVQAQGDKVELRSADGQLVYRQAERAVNYPAYAPQFPGSSTTLATEFEGAKGEKGVTWVQQTHEKPGKVLAFYKRAIAAKGHELQMEQASPDSATIVAALGPGYDKHVMVSATGHDSGVTIVSITAAQ